ncbi:translation initiation factor IF-2 [Apodospora peruviana]|uniref:Translation initiation factor IF-2, mitochondrial n=1 Tax=Apodospora peruviana TaxID=516989 RepID=A0AAE0M7B1_9PEZI|nr:translation initiation factor IF-2 [Apodospora peruviana]
MFRGGLWQKQRRGSSVCLLCRHRQLVALPATRRSYAWGQPANSNSSSPASSWSPNNAPRKQPTASSNDESTPFSFAPDVPIIPTINTPAQPPPTKGWGSSTWGSTRSSLNAKEREDREAAAAARRAEAEKAERLRKEAETEARRKEALAKVEAAAAARRRAYEIKQQSVPTSEASSSASSSSLGSFGASRLRYTPAPDRARPLPFGTKSWGYRRSDGKVGPSSSLPDPVGRKPEQGKLARDFWAEAELRSKRKNDATTQQTTRAEATTNGNGDQWEKLMTNIEPDQKTPPRKTTRNIDTSDWERPQDARPMIGAKSLNADDTWARTTPHLDGPTRSNPAKQTRDSRSTSATSDQERNWRQEPKPAATTPSEEPNRRDRSARSDRPEKPKKQTSRRNGREEEGEDDFEDVKERRRRKAERKAEKERERQLALAEAGPIPILLPEFISVANLASALGVKPKQFLQEMIDLGFEDINKESIMTGETAAIVAQEYGFEPTVETGEGQDLKPRPAAEDPSLLPPRPPVVTIMGHVDHGKTTLLDFLRKSSIAAQEHGGITQHIGAFSVEMKSGKQITFLDTPGHAAFVEMRQRGANVTDIAILVVAADDSVKPQTIEALKHARAAKVPIVVAITKADKPDANVDRVKSDLAAQGVEIEDFGGDVQVVPVSGKTGLGMDDLEENIVLLSEVMDIRAETDGMAEGWVLESSIKPIGRVATILVKRGTLRPGDFIVAGTVSTRIRTLRNEAGLEVDEAPPGTAVEVLGWKDPPAAGDQVLQAPDKDKADSAVRYRLEQNDRVDALSQLTQQDQDKREKAAAEAAAEKAGEDPAEVSEGHVGPKIVNFTVKGDVHGSVEAVCNSIQEIGNNEVRPRILMSHAGQITESDVDHAAVSGSHIINFNNPVPGHIKRMAGNAGVKILEHNIIYHLVEEVKDILSELLTPNISSKVVGEAEILQVFPINVKGRQYKNIAGCRIRNGHVGSASTVRIMRAGEEVFTGPIDTLKQGKKNVTEVKKGAECGVSFHGFEDFKQGDTIQVVEEVVEKRRLP